ncbi:dentin sialophosphoprotein [Limanda limanda]|uniref:dentin sialophosphoprotein n=1 Tax=Limanda limanda TaxID=27771 RepID=UPI0029C976DD|nr:dentin sialophosphoprotein [Limanda limanda]
MEQDLSNLLSDAFSDSSVPLFPDGDLDFESLNFNGNFEEDETGVADENRALHQEGTGETAVLLSTDPEDMYTSQSVDEVQFEDKEDFQGVRCPPEEDYTSSDGDCEPEGSVSGEDEDEEEDEDEDEGTADNPGDLLMSVCCSAGSGHEEDRILAEGLPLAPQGAENPQVRKVEQDDNESDEEVSYFERVPERGNEMMTKGDEITQDERESEGAKQGSDCESESMRVKQEENVESPYRGEPATAILEFPDISGQNLQDLIAEVDGRENVEKMEDFSGEEHEEAGEGFADYPSDFSSCEYVEDAFKQLESNSQASASPHTSDRGSKANREVCVEGAVVDVAWMGTEEDTDEQGGRYLCRRGLEMDLNVFRSYDVADRGKTETAGNVSCETDESESYSSSEDEVQVKRRDEELLDNKCLRDLQNDKKLEDTPLYRASSAAFSRWSTSDDHHITNNRAEPADFSTSWDLDVSKSASILSEDLSTAEDTDETETALSHMSQRPAEDINTCSVVQREESKSTSPSYQGSLDDSFFFNTEVQASGITELRQLGDDENEEDKSWEEERIKAFFRFYNDSEGEDEREERQTRVHFCADPLSQVIHYETDSERDSLSSSTDREDDPSSAETSEELKEPDDILETIPACDPPPDTELPESKPEKDVSPTQICSRRHKCLRILKSILKMGLVIVMGLLMFWLATDLPDWLFIWG